MGEKSSSGIAPRHALQTILNKTMRLIRLLKNDLARESLSWVEQEIISEEQAEKICRLYGADYHQIQTRSYAHTLLSGLGFLFIGLALITLIGANWQDIPRGLRMSGLIALTIATQAIAVLRYCRYSKSSGVGLFFLGNLFYGASIIAIAQIYHLGEHMPDGVFWWALGSLPFAVLTQSPWLHLQTLILASVWFFLESGYGFYPTWYPLFLAAAIWGLIHGAQSILLLLTTIGMGFIGFEYSLLFYWQANKHSDLAVELLPVTIALFIVTYAFSQWLFHQHCEKAKDYATVLKLWTLRFALLALLVMSFESPWVALVEETWHHLPSLILVMLLLAVLSLGFARQPKIERQVLLLWTALAVLLSTIIFLDTSRDALYLQVLDNLALVGTGIYLIVKGIDRGISHYFFLGVTTILFTAFLRYFDLIGDYIGGALLFFVFAILLLGSARYWKQQQQKQQTRYE